jgi:hypothetical protein
VRITEVHFHFTFVATVQVVCLAISSP